MFLFLIILELFFFGILWLCVHSLVSDLAILGFSSNYVYQKAPIIESIGFQSAVWRGWGGVKEEVVVGHGFCRCVFRSFILQAGLCMQQPQMYFQQISGMLFGHIFRKLLMRHLPTTLESAISFDICLKVFFQTNTSSCYTLPQQLPDI